MNRNWLGILGVIIVLSLAGAAYTFHTSPATPPVGAAGQDQYAFANFYGGMSVGQGITASSTAASVTLSGNEFINADTLDYTIGNAAAGTDVTLTLPASTTPLCSSLARGQRRNIFIRNATTTAGTVITLATSASIYLKSASTTLINGNTDGSNYAKIEIVKKPSTDCSALFTGYN